MKEKDINIEEGDSLQQEQEAQPEVENNAETEEVSTTEAEADPSPEEQAEAQIAELKDKYLRSVAEFDNYRKRTLKERAELILNGGEKVLTAILPVVDDMERAIDKLPSPQTSSFAGLRGWWPRSPYP